MRTSCRKIKDSNYQYEFINLGDIEFHIDSEYVDNRLSLITQPNKGFESQETKLKELFHNIIDVFESKTKLFRFDNPHEIFHWKEFWPLFKIIHNVFDERNLLNRLQFTDNNCDFKFKSNYWKYKGFPYMLGFPIRENQVENLIDRKINKHFLCLNRRPKFFREDIVRFLVESGIDKKSYYSFGVDGESNNHPLFHVLDKSLENIYPSMAKDTITLYEDNVFCYIVTEAIVDNEPTTGIEELDNEIYLNNNLYCHITEKTTRAIVGGIPFILVSSAGSIKKLHEFGFKTFGDWWDESYDSIISYEERIDKIKKVITQISEMSISQCDEMYKEMIPTLKHNQMKYQEMNKIFQTFDGMDMCYESNFPNQSQYFELFSNLRKRIEPLL